MWRTSRATPTPRAARSCRTRGENGRPALGDSALPGHAREDRLVVGERPRPRLVRVADRRPVGGQVGVQRRRDVEPRDPEPAAAEVRRDERGRAAAGQRQRLALRGAREPGAVAAQLDHPAAGRPPVVAAAQRARRRLGRRQVQRQRGPVRAPRGQRGREHRGLVDHEQVAGAQLRRDVAEARVDQRRLLARDHQAHGVARKPARLRRLRRLERLRQGERRARPLPRGRRDHAGASASARAP